MPCVIPCYSIETKRIDFECLTFESTGSFKSVEVMDNLTLKMRELLVSRNDSMPDRSVAARVSLVYSRLLNFMVSECKYCKNCKLCNDVFSILNTQKKYKEVAKLTVLFLNEQLSKKKLENFEFKVFDNYPGDKELLTEQKYHFETCLSLTNDSVFKEIMSCDEKLTEINWSYYMYDYCSQNYPEPNLEEFCYQFKRLDNFLDRASVTLTSIYKPVYE